MRIRRDSPAARDLPVVDACPADTLGGRAIRATLSTRGPFGVRVPRRRAAALEVPAHALDHPTGGRSDITVRAVTEAAERIRLIVLADAAERHHPDPAHRVASPRNHHLLEHGLWLVASAADGTPLMLCVAPVDGELATLRYFGTLADGEPPRETRYVMTHALVAELAARGVRWLLDTDRTGVVGFRDVRLRVHRSSAGVAAIAVPAFLTVEPYLERASALAGF